MAKTSRTAMNAVIVGSIHFVFSTEKTARATVQTSATVAARS